jgi:hypothetical protein
MGIRKKRGDLPWHWIAIQKRPHGTGQLYLPRLIGIGEPGSDVLISQDIKGTSDNVRFTFGMVERGTQWSPSWAGALS